MAVEITWLSILAWGALGIFSLIGFRFLYARHANLSRNYTEILSLTIGALCTFYLNISLELGPVIAAGIVGVLASYIPMIDRNNTHLKLLPFSIYCGAFVGMSSGFILETYYAVALAGLLAGIIYVLANNTLNGIGGKHGTIAFTGVLIIKTMLYVL